MVSAKKHVPIVKKRMFARPACFFLVSAPWMGPIVSVCRAVDALSYEREKHSWREVSNKNVCLKGIGHSRILTQLDPKEWRCAKGYNCLAE